MECPNLKEMCDLIRTYTDYTSHVSIARRLKLGEGTLRGYWERYGGHIPDRNEDAFAGLIQEILPIGLTKAAALAVLQGSPLAFHNLLLPVGGAGWRDLLCEEVELEITIPSPAPTGARHALGFGEIEDRRVADRTIGMNEPFRFRGEMAWPGEGFIAAEHGGVWHLIALAIDQRGFRFPAGRNEIPSGVGNYLQERQNPGFYKYFVIGLRDSIPVPVRHQIQRANPYSQLDLDLLASMLLQSPRSDRIVLGATLRVNGPGD